MPYAKRKGKKPGFGKKLARATKKYLGIGKQRTLNVPNISSMARQVASMASMINAEKKILSIGSSNTLATGVVVGQVDQNVSGMRCFDLTPMMPQGTGASDRTGNSIKLHSSYFQFQVQNQTAVATAQRITIELWSNPSKTIDSANVPADLYVANPFSTVIDATSARNPDHFNDYRCILRKTVYLPPDNITGQLATRQIAVPFKWNKGKGHHVRFTGSGYTNYLTDVQSGQTLLIYKCDNGNSSTGTASTLNIPVTAINTGAVVRMSYRHYYYDN